MKINKKGNQDEADFVSFAFSAIRGRVCLDLTPAPDWHPGYKTEALLRKSYLFVEESNATL
jgi:hypothetical protein